MFSWMDRFIRVIKLGRDGWIGRSYNMRGIVRNTYRIVARTPEGNRPIWRHWHRWEDDNIMMDCKGNNVWQNAGVIWLSVGYVQSLANTVISLWDPQKVWSFLTAWLTVGFSCRTMIYDCYWSSVIPFLVLKLSVFSNLAHHTENFFMT